MLTMDQLRPKFEEAGLRLGSIETESILHNRVPDFLVTADVDGREVPLAIEIKERPHLADLRLAVDQLKHYAEPNRVLVIASQFMGPNRRALLKEMGVGYIDLAGNIYLRAPGILIDREEKRNPFGYEREGLNPYADKASIVLRVLMDEPNRSWKIREIASVGRINPGWVSRVVKMLIERSIVKFSRGDGVTLLRGDDLLKEWADLYDWRRNKFHHYYCHALDSQEVIEKISELKLDSDKSVALGFQAGAYLVSPYSTFNQVHLMIDGWAFDAIRPQVEQQLHLEPRREGANLILVRPYYKHSALFGVRRIKRCYVVSDIQLYVDLNKYPIRGQEQAEHLLQKIIMPRFKKMVGSRRGSKR